MPHVQQQPVFKCQSQIFCLLIKSKYKTQGIAGARSPDEHSTKYCFAVLTADVAKANENSNALSEGTHLQLLPYHQGSVSAIYFFFFSPKEKTVNFCFTSVVFLLKKYRFHKCEVYTKCMHRLLVS